MDLDDTPFMADVRRQVDAQVRAKSETAGQITLGQLIDLVEKRPPDQDVYLDHHHLRPKGIGSYRGHYDQLAIEYDCDDHPRVTTAEFLKMLREVEGKTLTGYKGGDYLMTRDTMVWVSNYGKATDVAVTGIIERYDWAVYITCAYIG